MIENALQYEIENDAGVIALGLPKVRPARADYKDDVPYIVLSRTDSDHQGHQTGDAKIDEVVFRIECVHDIYLSAVTLGDAVFAAINRFQGDMGESGKTEDVRNVIIEGMQDNLAGPSDGHEKPLYIRTIVARMSHRRV